ncbi:MAG TPA: hypothetical protein VGS27_02200 [Candidatus Sulfotelmatobacter sp.]|nr:hypothetical protein [Candidatus Sulfotelmatobacter sp.]
MHVPLWLLRRSSDPIWFFSGAINGSAPLASPFLDPNVGFTSEALGHLAVWDWLHLIVPWWNPYTGIGMPLAGELQPGAFFLPFSLLLGLPEGILWLQLSMQIIAGVSTYVLLRELELSRLASWMGGALFALNGTIAWTPGPASVYCMLPFLPLLLFGIERARKQDQGATSILIIGAATAWSILSGFPETAYISSLPLLAWGIYRFAYDPLRWRLARRATTGLVLGTLVAAPLLIAFVDYMRQSNSFEVHNRGGMSLPGAAFAANAMPYVYGSLGTSVHSTSLSHIWAAIGGYTTPLVILLAAASLTSSSAHRGLKILLVGWILVAFAKTFGVQPITGLLNHLPLMRQTVFFRYAPPSWELALIILAAFGLDEFRKRMPALLGPFAITMSLVAIGVALAWPQRAFWERPRSFVPIAFLFLGLSLAWALAELLAAGLVWKRFSGERRRVALASLLVIDAAIMFVVPQSNSVRAGQIDAPAIQFLRGHLGLSRICSLGPIHPNYGAYFQVASINHNVEPIPKIWVDHIERNLLPGFSKIDLSETFWAGVMPDGEGERAFARYLPNYLDLGVRYVVTNAGETPMPTIFVPPTGAQNPATISSGSSHKLKKVTAVLERFQSVSNDQAKPAIERWVAKATLKIVGRITGGSRLFNVRKEGQSVETSDTDSVWLKSGQSSEISVLAPAPIPAGSPITSVGVIVSNSADTVQGNLVVEICAGNVCRSGQRPISALTENSIFRIPLGQPLFATAGTPLLLTLTHQNGSLPVALQLGTPVADLPEQATGPNCAVPGCAVPGRVLQLAFEYGTALPGLRKAYADSLMDIWELPNPAPYLQVIQGGPCELQTTRREDVTAECVSPATLVRRELYMPGWGATINGAAAEPIQPTGIFQSLRLPQGHSEVRYRFAPPYVDFGWAASVMGFAGLIWQAVLVMRSQRTRQNTLHQNEGTL